ncbi:hypothetical protein JTB14_022279 [Gonioctena quinquepunctata]|nr:hypothetical protein JTB14_022279 [Gonioctena quinquepunctata]
MGWSNVDHYRKPVRWSGFASATDDSHGVFQLDVKPSSSFRAFSVLARMLWLKPKAESERFSALNVPWLCVALDRSQKWSPPCYGESVRAIGGDSDRSKALAGYAALPCWAIFSYQTHENKNKRTSNQKKMDLLGMEYQGLSPHEGSQSIELYLMKVQQKWLEEALNTTDQIEEYVGLKTKEHSDKPKEVRFFANAKEIEDE